ncbi:MAG TPA: response regulator [Gemmatimonadales bacterium]|jgi:CheY-like chemotaxis protein|nr:response regulator [Gemmatimonadales bacterium]
MASILVVEDNPDNMKLFRTLLVMKGHQVTGLPSGDGLLETMAQARPELVLMDIQLPGRDGYALLSELRASPWAGVSVVALTAHAMSGDQEKARAAGFDDYITKPIDIATFGDQVARALRLRRPPTETRGRG